MCQPDRAATHQFAGQLLADLARLVDEYAKRNAARGQCEEMRAESKEFEALRADLFKLPE